MTLVMKKDFNKMMIALMVGGLLLSVVSLFASSEIVMVLQRAGYNVPNWVGDSLTTISTVYGVQAYLLGILGVTIAPALAAAIVALSVGAL
ncbi:hypothetical protein [Metabacillus idriensis]|uniref:hypothetical protein n=1 Tax=Metabacillus idriensis TaxID=324768 RepID=UPI0017489D3B|nr:hypothetical protein [Metabacillus idriensis]